MLIQKDPDIKTQVPGFLPASTHLQLMKPQKEHQIARQA
jgi:hypothetical protein